MNDGKKRSYGYQRRHFRPLPDHRKAFGLANLDPLCSPWRFSPRVWGSSRGAQLWQQFAHRATNLLQGRLAMSAFPRMQGDACEVASQHQQVVGDSDSHLARSAASAGPRRGWDGDLVVENAGTSHAQKKVCRSWEPVRSVRCCMSLGIAFSKAARGAAPAMLNGCAKVAR